MRRAGPILIVLIGVVALLICFFPGLTLPDATSATGSRVVETKLGLDLSGGLRVEYLAQPVEGKTPTAADMAIIKDIVERRVNQTGVSEPVVVDPGLRPDRRRAAGRHRPGFRPPAGRPDRPPRLRPARPDDRAGRPDPRPEAVPAALQRRPGPVGVDRPGPVRRPDGRLRAQGRRRQAVRRLHRPRTSATTSRSPSTGRSSRRRSSRTRSPTGRSRSRPAASAASR